MRSRFGIGAGALAGVVGIGSLRQEYAKNAQGVLVPKKRATMIGFGCPKHDDHELCAVEGNEAKCPPNVLAFLKTHKSCGMLQVLEKHLDGKLYVTGALDPKDPGRKIKLS